MKIIPSLRYPKNIVIMMILASFSLNACSGGKGTQVSLNSDPLWEELAQMQKTLLNQNKTPSSEGPRIEQIYEPAKNSSEGGEKPLVEEFEITSALDRLETMIGSFLKAVVKFEKMPTEDREFEMIQVDRLFSRLITQKMKWDEFLVTSKDATIFTEKFNAAEQIYHRITSKDHSAVEGDF